VNSSAADAPIKLIFLLLHTPPQKKTKNNRNRRKNKNKTTKEKQ